MSYIIVEDVHYPPGKCHNSSLCQVLPSHTHPEMPEARIGYRCQAYKVVYTIHKYCLLVDFHAIQESQIQQLLDNRLCFSDYRKELHLIEARTLNLEMFSNRQKKLVSNSPSLYMFYKIQNKSEKNILSITTCLLFKGYPSILYPAWILYQTTFCRCKTSMTTCTIRSARVFKYCVASPARVTKFLCSKESFELTLTYTLASFGSNLKTSSGYESVRYISTKYRWLCF